MTTNKYNRILKASKTAVYPRIFNDRLKDIPDEIINCLSAKKIASIIDVAMEASYKAGIASGE